MLLAIPPRLKANSPLQSSCFSLDPQHAREFSANHGGNAHLWPARRKPLLAFLCVLAATICVSGLLTQME
jgi:hypothetical protein